MPNYRNETKTKVDEMEAGVLQHLPDVLRETKTLGSTTFFEDLPSGKPVRITTHIDNGIVKAHIKVGNPISDIIGMNGTAEVNGDVATVRMDIYKKGGFTMSEKKILTGYNSDLLRGLEKTVTINI